MKIMTWNLNGRTPSGVWEYIEEEIRPDVAFVQEAVDPKGLNFPEDRWLWKEIGENSKYKEAGKYRWATGIRVQTGTLRPIEDHDRGGWIVAAEWESDHGTFTLINVHIELFPDKYATSTLTKTIDTFESRLAGDRVIFGGDLNVDRLFDTVYGGDRNNQVLDRLGELGLFHTNTLLPEGTRTYKKSKHPYQDDHLFVSHGLQNSIQSVHVLENDRTDSLSDHYPVVVDVS